MLHFISHKDSVKRYNHKSITITLSLTYATVFTNAAEAVQKLHVPQINDK